MKRYKLWNDRNQIWYSLVVGTARETRSLYRNLKDHDFRPLIAFHPSLTSGKMYGIVINSNRWYHVVNADTIVSILVQEGR